MDNNKWISLRQMSVELCEQDDVKNSPQINAAMSNRICKITCEMLAKNSWSVVKLNLTPTLINDDKIGKHLSSDQIYRAIKILNSWFKYYDKEGSQIRQKASQLIDRYK